MKITKTSLLTIIFGMVISQAGWLVAGIALLRLIYVDKWHFIPEDQMAPLTLLTALSVLLLGAGAAKGCAIARNLEKGKIARGRLLKVEADNSGEDTEYLMTFAYTDDPGSRHSLQIKRQRNDLALGNEFPILIDEQTGEGLLELDLPGGTKFANFQGTQPIRSIVFLRILVVPLLAVAPLLGAAPPIAVILQHLVDSMQTWLVCGWSVGVQIIWFFANRRHFTFKATHIACRCETQAETEKVHPAHSTGGPR
ncbi:MAG TPA: hypothetical protein VGI88_14495 [Verrucomicrobiae bacterium]|jgi:hypothetical protein